LRNRLERTSLTDGGTIRVGRREHETPQFACAGTAEDVRQRLLVDITDNEVSAAIDDAAYDFAVRVYDSVLKRVPTPKTVLAHRLVC
jgi:hypothetical protein